MKVRSLNWEGFGDWSFPRCYYFPIAGNFASAAMFITTPDLTSPQYRALIREACSGSGGPDFHELMSVLTDKAVAPPTGTQIDGWITAAGGPAEEPSVWPFDFSQFDFEFERRSKRKKSARVARCRYNRFDTGVTVRIMPL